MIAQQGTVVGLVVIMALYLVARGTRGLILAPRDATVDAIVRVLWFAVIQGALVAVLTRVVAP